MLKGQVGDLVNVGDRVTVRVREIDNRGRINLSLRGVPQDGSDPEPTVILPIGEV